MSKRKSLFVRTRPKPTRAEILSLYDQGLGTQEVSVRLEISEAWARRVKQERREQGKTANATTRNRQPKWATLVPEIRAAIAARPDLTLDELKVELGTTLHPGTLCRALQKLKLTFKKKVVRAAEQDRPDVAAQRADWVVKQAGLDPDQLLFLDEFGAKTNFTRTHGRSLEGTRLVAKVPYGHWKSTTFVGALGLRGWVAPLVIDGALNGELFRAYVEQHLAPQLRAGDVLILDNLACHKVAGVRDALQRVGADVLYLPPYSPDFNPIEQAFSKLKRLLRSAAPRTVDALWTACGAELAKFHPSEFQNYLTHCGYRYS